MAISNAKANEQISEHADEIVRLNTQYGKLDVEYAVLNSYYKELSNAGSKVYFAVRNAQIDLQEYRDTVALTLSPGSGSRYYHYYGCEDFEPNGTYYIYSDEGAERNGVTLCTKCRLRGEKEAKEAADALNKLYIALLHSS